MSFISDLFSGGASGVLDSVGNVLGKVITTKGEKMQLENETRKAERDFQLEMQKLSVEERRMSYEDIGSARSREVEITKSDHATWLQKNIAVLLAITATVLCFLLFYLFVFKPGMIQVVDRDLIMYILGVLSALLTQVYSYYFGSSQGSADKGRTMSAQLLHKETK